MSEEVNYPINGSCQCGQVSYEIVKPPIYLAVCHCSECQKASASAFGMTMVLTSDSIKFTGELKIWERSSDNGNLNQAHFCPTCGNRIYHLNPDQADIIKLKPGTLENTELLEPNSHLWVSKKQKWVVIPEGIEQHDTQPAW